MQTYLFSTIMYIDRSDLFSQAVASLRENGLDEYKAQFIIIDPGSCDEARELCAEEPRYLYIQQPDILMAAAYNTGLAQAEGEYIHFTLASVTYEGYLYRKAKRLFSQFDVPMITGRPFFRTEGAEDVPYGGSTMPREKEDQVDLTENPGRFQLAIWAYLFKAELFEQRRFDETLHDDALFQLLIGLQAAYPCFCHVRYLFCYYHTPMEDNVSVNPFQYEPWWYQAAGGWMRDILEEVQGKEDQKAAAFVQHACWYLLYARFNCNMNDRNKGVLEDLESVKAFAASAYQTLTFIDNGIIAKRGITSYTNADRVIRMQMLRGKARALGGTSYVTREDGHFVLKVKKEDVWQSDFAVLQRCDNEKLRVRIINYENDRITIEANFPVSDYLDRDQYEVYAVSEAFGGGKTRIAACDLPDYPLVKCFGYTFRRKCPLSFTVPITGKGQKVSFYYVFEDQTYPLKLDFSAVGARLCQDIPQSYWVFRPHWYLTCEDEQTIILRYAQRTELHHCEEAFEAALKETEQDENKAEKGLALRREYWKRKHAFFKKPIWVTFDKLFKAGDNGEYMYQYIRNNCRDVEIYYIIREDSPDYERLMAQDKKHILIYGSMHCRLICALAEVVLASHADVTAKYDAGNEYRRYTKDLFNGQVVCIQHGLTIQNIAQYQNRQFDNTRLYCCASPYEVRNLSRPIYGYRQDQIRLTGLARFDGLINRDRRFILITPSWRRNIASAGKANAHRAYNENFKHSTYFKIYNQLINDEKLISSAKVRGYRIVFLVHPEMSAQTIDFDQHEGVEIIPATSGVSYEQILCEASLMVTDYSGIQFDFAYMRKPIVYYHPAALPPQYDDGGMNYQTMGFGPICTDHETVTDAICSYMNADCSNSDEYIQRADDFFAFDDHKNCERIYQTVKRWYQKRM